MSILILSNPTFQLALMTNFLPCLCVCVCVCVCVCERERERKERLLCVYTHITEVITSYIPGPTLSNGSYSFIAKRIIRYTVRRACALIRVFIAILPAQRMRSRIKICACCG